MGKISYIIFAVVIILNVLGGIMKKRTEAQRQQKLASMSTRKSQSSAQVQHRPAHVQHRDTHVKHREGNPYSSPSTRADRAMGRAEKLAARRKAQLDELRRRREHKASFEQQQQQQQQHPQARIGPGTSQAPSTFRSTPQQFPQPTPAKPQRTVIRPSAQPQQSSRATRKSAEPSQPTTLREDSKRLRRINVVEDRDAFAIKRTAYDLAEISPTSSNIDIGELTPELLRRMVVLKEIFDKPVAMRESEIWDRL